MRSPSERSPEAAPQKILVIQTAFLGDVVLATGVLESLHHALPGARLDFLLRKGNEGLVQGHPFIGKLHVWDKKGGKWASLRRQIAALRRERYDLVVNLQRFASSGLMTVFSGAKETRGFAKNPWSRFFTQRFPHPISHKDDAQVWHETQRNHQLVRDLCGHVRRMPRLYPSDADYAAVKGYQERPYVCIAPASVWFTKQFPEEKWVSFLQRIPARLQVWLLGSPADTALCERIVAAAGRSGAGSLAGALSLLETAALMRDARMNYVNDSAPLHIASAMEAPQRAIFCSTVPQFGFGPLNAQSAVIETNRRLACKPCGLHGKRQCPQGHFLCADSIRTEQLLEPLVGADSGQAPGAGRSIPRKGMG